jgi:putative SbcD/Mre11-related phosphoesterase
MALVDPVPGEPAAIADLDQRTLIVADYHAGIEWQLRREGVEVRSNADERREHLLGVVDETDAERVIVLGDLGHAIGTPEGAEYDELEALFDALSVPVTLVVGNHDGGLGNEFDVDTTPPDGARFGDVGFAHGHTWPSQEVLEAETVCVGHEHPAVRLEDDVGGRRVERAWLRGPLDAAPFEEYHGEAIDADGELVVFPAFNDLSGGTWVNVAGQGFLAPFMPEACPDAEAYLLNGTRLGRYDRI